MRAGQGAVVLVVGLAVTAFSTLPAARAQPDPSGADGDDAGADKPWARGVPPEAQEEALRLFRAGNQRFEESEYAQAVALYRQALQLWDHPRIHVNIAECLVHLDRPLDAHEHLGRALAHGAAPFSRETYQRVLTNQKHLAGRLARLQVETAQPGVLVVMDGIELLRGPGRADRTVMPGRHGLVATRPGHVTLSRRLNLLPGKSTTLSITLSRPVVTVRTVRRFRRWVPWTVMASGTAAVLLGAGMASLAESGYRQYDRDFATLCPTGCDEDTLPGSVRAVKRRAARWDTASVSFLAAGGLTAATGLVLLVLNQPRTVPTVSPTTAARLQLSPQAGPGFAGLQAQLRF